MSPNPTSALDRFTQLAVRPCLPRGGLSHLWQSTGALETQGGLEKCVGGIELEQVINQHSTPDLIKVSASHAVASGLNYTCFIMGHSVAQTNTCFVMCVCNAGPRETGINTWCRAFYAYGESLFYKKEMAHTHTVWPHLLKKSSCFDVAFAQAKRVGGLRE